MRKAICLPAVLLLLSCLKAAQSHAQPHRHLHQLHHGHVHKLGFNEEDSGERVSRILSGSAPRPAHAPSQGLIPAPAAAPSPGNTPAAPLLDSGFNPAAENDTHCGSPVKKPSMALALNIFFELLQEGLPPNMTFQGNLTTLSQWRSILNNPLKLARLWPDVRSLAQEYFNLTIPADFTKVASKLPKYDVKATSRRLLQTSANSTLTVPVYFTVVTDPGAFVGGGDTVTLDSIKQQMAFLNTAYQNAGFRFILGDSPILVKNARFFHAQDSSTADFYYKNQYRRGGSEALNVYVRKPTAKGLGDNMILLGIARFPESLCANGAQDSNRLIDDGISLLYETLPDQESGYLGATLVHETGHWLGLLHTFNYPSSCDPSSVGDGVSATPVESGPYNQNPNYIEGKCDKTFDSCPNLPGFDPINNWMDYSPDECYETFRPEQITFMRANYVHLRQQKQCSYPGQVSPFLDSQKQDGSGTTVRPRLSGLLLACLALLAFMCLL